jgi:hypothetical protein
VDSYPKLLGRTAETRALTTTYKRHFICAVYAGMGGKWRPFGT